jgi:putative SOS response-associated peptidase YedK
MCGRFTLRNTSDEIARVFNIQAFEAPLDARYNIAPQQTVLAVVQREESYVATPMRWGLVPFWAKDDAIGNQLINARAETLADKPSFKRPLKCQRCLVVADGFYEWRKADGRKVPIFIHRKDDQPFGFAGLYDTWQAPDGQPLTTCTIITTTPNALLRPIHERMPVILPRDAQSLWLDPANQDVDELVALLKPFAGDELEAYEVSRFVNAPENDSPECIAPLMAHA